jgi:GxxExxY protein
MPLMTWAMKRSRSVRRWTSAGCMHRKVTAHHGDTENTEVARISPLVSAVKGYTTNGNHDELPPWGHLCRELQLRGVPHLSEVELPLEYKGVQIRRGYIIDLLIDDVLIVEIKSVDKLLPIHGSQLMTYMHLERVPTGLLINFNVQTLRAPCSPCLRGAQVQFIDTRDRACAGI